MRLSNGTTSLRTCRYIDDYHLEVGSYVYHICEFAEHCERNGHTVEPAEKTTAPPKRKTKHLKDKEAMTDGKKI